MLDTFRGGDGCEMMPARHQEFDPSHFPIFAYLTHRTPTVLCPSVPPNHRTLPRSDPVNYRTCASIWSHDEYSSKEGRLGGHFQRERVDSALVDLT